MKLTIWGAGILLLVFGFLGGTTIYYYHQCQLLSDKRSSSASKDFSGEHPLLTNQLSEQISKLTVPAEPKNSLTYPANTYVINSGESLFIIASKIGLPYSVIKRANSITDENRLEAGRRLVVPVIDESTDLYRLKFLLNEAAITDYNAKLRDSNSQELVDPVNAARKFAVGYFNLKATDDFHLYKADLSKGESTVEVKSATGGNYIVGLIQPKIVGEKGFWVMLYIEEHNV